MDKRDTDEWSNLKELIDYVNQSGLALSAILAKQSEEDWVASITTKEFGSKTKAEAFGRIVSHTAYHAGQMALVLKHGK
ncbi:MAG: DinB family protein [Flavobacteriales bacterium]|nr:DinB family protein [Flavobacteriales bacterium]